MKVFKDYEDYRLNKNRDNIEEALEAYLISKNRSSSNFPNSNRSYRNLNGKLQNCFIGLKSRKRSEIHIRKS